MESMSARAALYIAARFLPFLLFILFCRGLLDGIVLDSSRGFLEHREQAFLAVWDGLYRQVALNAESEFFVPSVLAGVVKTNGIVAVAWSCHNGIVVVA